MADDLDHYDQEFDPEAQDDPKDSAPWLNLLNDAEKKFRSWQDHADRIDELYADLERWSGRSNDPQFAMFWANIQIMAPSIYARKPVPVVVPEFKDRDPVKRAASEMLERALVKSWDLDDLDQTMRLCRDDLLIDGRGVLWCRYETKAEAQADPKYNSSYERVCVEFLDRRDFRHAPARIWPEVGWVARGAWLTRKEMRERFKKHSGDKYLEAAYNAQGDSGKSAKPDEGSDPQEKALVWELWHKAQDTVVWVSEGVDKVLDQGVPHHKLDGFFPCPRPAYSTLQRRTLVPVPDINYYRSQLEEINKLTARIHALSDAIQVKGFYPAGGEIGDAIEAALSINDNRKVMIPVSNFAAFGSGGDPIIWLPIDQIAETIAALIEMRRQVIEDVYQIVGLSDIMRGTVDPDEKLGQSQLKSQYGSIRIRDKQYELVRIARDVARISGEMMAENFAPKTFLALSQMSLPTDREIAQQIGQIKQMVAQTAQQAQQMLASPQAQQMAQQNPEEAQQALQQMKQQAEQALQQAQSQIQELEDTATIEKVMGLFRDERLRPYALDIETDSTIAPDEDAEKQRSVELITAFAGYMKEVIPVVQMAPQAAPMAGEVLKQGLKAFRANRSLEDSIEDFIDGLQQQSKDKPPSPEEMKAQAEMQKMQMDAQTKQQELETKTQIEQMKLQAEGEQQEREFELKREEMMLDMERKDRESKAKMAEQAQKHDAEMKKLQVELVKINKEIEATDHRIQADRENALIQQATAKQEAVFKEQDAARQDRLAEHKMSRENKSDAFQSRFDEMDKASKEPREVIRDPKTNRVAGVKMNGTTRMVTRDPQTNRITRLEGAR